MDMTTRNVTLTEELDQFVSDEIKSGRYGDESEVVRAALRTLEREECEEREYQTKLAALREAIAEGDATGIAEEDVLERVRQRLRLGATRR